MPTPAAVRAWTGGIITLLVCGIASQLSTSTAAFSDQTATATEFGMVEVADIMLIGWKDPAAATNGITVNNSAPSYSNGYTAAVTTGGISIGSAPEHLLFEIAVFDRRLSDGEMQLVKAYLSDKWALEL